MCKKCDRTGIVAVRDKAGELLSTHTCDCKIGRIRSSCLDGTIGTNRSFSEKGSQIIRK